MKRGAAAGSAAEAAAACARAERFEGDCRSLWVSQRLPTDTPAAALLAVCGASRDRGSYDCTFQVLDARPDPDLLVQIDACIQRAGPMGDDCAIHALDRWRRGHPSAAELRRVAAAGPLPERTGRVVAAVVACQGVGDCGEHPALGPACRAALEEIAQHPEICSE